VWESVLCERVLCGRVYCVRECGREYFVHEEGGESIVCIVWLRSVHCVGESIVCKRKEEYCVRECCVRVYTRK